MKDPFHQDRWDYVQTFSRRGNPMVKRTVTLMFDDMVSGDYCRVNLVQVVGLCDIIPCH
ncbi:MAG: outer membrane protein assembly factor BamE domain-containing protein [Planktomarina sp.]